MYNADGRPFNLNRQRNDLLVAGGNRQGHNDVLRTFLLTWARKWAEEHSISSELTESIQNSRKLLRVADKFAQLSSYAGKVTYQKSFSSGFLIALSAHVDPTVSTPFSVSDGGRGERRLVAD